VSDDPQRGACTTGVADYELFAQEILGRDLREFSLDTMRMFHCDAQAAGFVR
jgi:hypothetical protein